MMSLTAAQKKTLRSVGHILDPVVRIGDKGLTEGVMGELERALADHELIKISIAGADRDERTHIINHLLEQSGAELVQSIGKTALLYRHNPKADPRLSNVARYTQ
nr:ribosome assembly RNA-binding protein YhbY [Kushneria avicenniae]